MYKHITDRAEYIHHLEVSNLPISHGENSIKIKLFDKELLVNKDDVWLRHLHLKVTDICNAKCNFCVEKDSHIKSDPKRFLQQTDAMLYEMEKAGILFSVSVTGGEPMLFDDLIGLYNILEYHDIKFLTMNTNGEYLRNKINWIDGLFDFIDISRHSLSDYRNCKIFDCDMPSVSELIELRQNMKKTKMRLQCVMVDMHNIDDFLQFVDQFSFADDLSFRRLMKVPNQGYDTNDDLYFEILDYAYNNFEFKEQTIQDYYVYEIWNNGTTDITFSYSDMSMLLKNEETEDDRICREFIIHPNGTITGSWNINNKIIKV